MIRLSGPAKANAGKSFCVTATNVGAGLTVKATIAGSAVAVSITHDVETKTATICFKIPPGSKGGIEIQATDNATTGYVTHSAIIRRR